jgi:hypothetical protein
LSPGLDGIVYTSDDKLEVVPRGEVVQISPFDRLVVACKIPCFDDKIYSCDCICLLKYSSDPRKGKATSEFILSEMRESRTYLNEKFNKEFYGEDTILWNAPRDFRSYNESRVRQDNKINGRERNFQYMDIVGHDVEDVDNKYAVLSEKSASLLKKGGIQKMKSVVYTPILREPGFYTVRYCLDDLNLPDDTWAYSISEKSLELSPKSYYYDRSIEEFQESRVELSATKIKTSII